MRIRWQMFVMLLGIGLLAACSSGDDDATLAEIAADGWQMIEGGEGTACAFGDPYAFFARTGIDAENVVIYFQAGGACWSAESCLADSPLPVYDQTVTPGEFTWYGGIFDFANPDNPLRAYDILFVPLCTGDAHVGDATVTYESAAGLLEVTVNHYGVRNVQAALDWFYQTYDTPERVLVMGSSAGSLGSLYYFPQIAEQYPAADIALFGDGYIGVFPTGWDAMQRWNFQANLPAHIPGINDLDLTNFSIIDIMLAATNFYPQDRFAIYSHAADSFQMAYYGLAGGDMTAWYLERQRVLDAYEQQPNLHYYLGEGVLHTILAFDELYSMTTEDIRFRDWFTAFIEGEPVDNVTCSLGNILCP